MAASGRSPRSGVVRARSSLLCAAIAATVAAGLANVAAAQWRPSGAVTAGAVVHRGDVGATALVDLWEAFGVLRLGGCFGVAALPSDNRDRSRVSMPLGLSAALAVQTSSLGMDLRVRTGAWGGATSDGLTGGGWLAVGAHVEYALDSKVALSAGVDGWFHFDEHSPRYIVPGVGLVWTLPHE